MADLLLLVAHQFGDRVGLFAFADVGRLVDDVGLLPQTFHLGFSLTWIHSSDRRACGGLISTRRAKRRAAAGGNRPYPSLLAGLGLCDLLDRAGVQLLHFGTVQLDVGFGHWLARNAELVLLVLEPGRPPPTVTSRVRSGWHGNLVRRGDGWGARTRHPPSRQRILVVRGVSVETLVHERLAALLHEDARQRELLWREGEPCVQMRRPQEQGRRGRGTGTASWVSGAGRAGENSGGWGSTNRTTWCRCW